MCVLTKTFEHNCISVSFAILQCSCSCVVYFHLAFGAHSNRNSISSTYIILAPSLHAKENTTNNFCAHHSHTHTTIPWQNVEMVISFDSLESSCYSMVYVTKHGIVIFATPMNSMHSITTFLSLQEQEQCES